MSPRKAAALRGRDDTDLRGHLVATAAELLAGRGAAGLTVRMIARKAGVADGVLYNYFADKEALLAVALRAHVDTVHAELGPLPAAGTASVPENLTAYLRAGVVIHCRLIPVFASLVAHPAVLTRFHSMSGADRDWRGQLLGYLRVERVIGRLGATADVDAAATLLAGICHEEALAALLPMLDHGPRVTPEAVVTTLLTSLGRGVS